MLSKSRVNLVWLKDQMHRHLDTKYQTLTTRKIIFSIIRKEKCLHKYYRFWSYDPTSYSQTIDPSFFL